jgi:hypothetical protein
MLAGEKSQRGGKPIQMAEREVGIGKKAQERARDVEGSSREVAGISPQRVCVDEGSFHQREVDLSGLRSMQPSKSPLRMG